VDYVYLDRPPTVISAPIQQVILYHGPAWSPIFTAVPYWYPTPDAAVNYPFTGILVSAYPWNPIAVWSDYRNSSTLLEIYLTIHWTVPSIGCGAHGPDPETCTPGTVIWTCDDQTGRWQWGCDQRWITLNTITPNSGPTAGATPVTITGTHFASGARVTFDRIPATAVTVVDANTITATTPAHAAGRVEVTLDWPHGGRISWTNAFTYVPPPTVTAVTPNRGFNGGRTPVTITGTNFAQGATVLFGGIAATNVTFVSGTALTANTPAHAIGPVEVRVIVNGQTGSMANAFTYVMDPAQIMSVMSAVLQ
jgi:hypothetical protein